MGAPQLYIFWAKNVKTTSPDVSDGDDDDQDAEMTYNIRQRQTNRRSRVARTP